MLQHQLIIKDSIERLEKETLEAIKGGQKEKALKLFQEAGNLFAQGGLFMQTIIANEFIYPISIFLEVNYSIGRQYLQLFPEPLKKEYLRQVYASGC